MSVQIIVEYMRFKDELHRLNITIERTGEHILKTIFLLLLTCVPVIFAPVQLYFMANLLMTLAAVLILLHVFFFIPITLNALPKCLLGSNFCYESD